MPEVWRGGARRMICALRRWLRFAVTVICVLQSRHVGACPQTRGVHRD